MQRNSVTSLPPALETWRKIRELQGVDAETAYGCVDWYPYHDAAPNARVGRSEPGTRERSAPANRSRPEAIRGG